MPLEEAREGSRLALSRALSLVENGLPFSSDAEGTVLGITGAPGVGKSCLVDRLAAAYAREGEKVAILAIDPSSPVSGGALLGDRLRMEDSSLEELVFIRSVATRGESGAVPSVVNDMVNVLKDCGWRRIIIETVGAGQAELRIAAVADIIALVEAPGRGDSIQAEKAGIIELVDLIVVNKSDLKGANMAAADIRSAQAAGKHQVPVHLVSARTGDGVSHLIKLIDDCTPSEVSRIRWRERLASVWMRRFSKNPKLEQVLTALEAGELDLTQAMNELEGAVE